MRLSRQIVLCATVLLNLYSEGNVFAQSNPIPAKIDTPLLLPEYYFDWPIYIKNGHYVVYELGSTRKIIYPDMASFKIKEWRSGLATDKNGVYFRGEFIKTDPDSFSVIGDISSDKGFRWFWKSGNKVFRDAEQLQRLDGQTFELLSSDGKYYKDKNAVYYLDEKIEGADPKLSKVLNFNGPIYYKGKIVRDSAGKPYFSVNYTFEKTSDHVFARGKIMPNIDAATLTGLSEHYSMDKAHVYFDTIPTPIEPGQFGRVKVWEWANYAYVSDGVRVYSTASYLTKFDGRTFGLIGQTDICYDAGGIYCPPNRLAEKRRSRSGNDYYTKLPFNYTSADSTSKATFTPFSNTYLLYGHQAYDFERDTVYTNLTEPEIDALKSGRVFLGNTRDTVKQVGNRFFIGCSKLYLRYLKKELQCIDAKSFVYLTDYMVKDKNHVFFITETGECRVIEGMDRETFKHAWQPTFSGNPLFEDKNYLYLNEHRLIRNSSLELLAVYRATGNTEEGGGGEYSDNYLFKNNDGYWLIQTLHAPVVKYLGKKFDRKWNNTFELPKE